MRVRSCRALGGERLPARAAVCAQAVAGRVSVSLLQLPTVRVLSLRAVRHMRALLTFASIRIPRLSPSPGFVQAPLETQYGIALATLERIRR